MSVLILTHPDCLDHDPGEGHPEHPGRLRAVLDALESPELADLPREEAAAATHEQLIRVHTADYVDAVLAAVPQEGRVGLDADTLMSPGSGRATLAACGAVVRAVEVVVGQSAGRAFCAVRPPGHHAESALATGFCLFNAIAVGAAHALSEGVERVAIIDFDVHHGNGTQEIFWDEPRVLYASTHQMPLYPGTGAAEESGGKGHIVNRPLPPGSGSEAFRAAWETLCERIDQFAPGLILVSAGFDAHRLDPLADLNLETEDYRWLTARLVELANSHCEGRLVSVLEGGYSLAALREAVTAHVRALRPGR